MLHFVDDVTSELFDLAPLRLGIFFMCVAATMTAAAVTAGSGSCAPSLMGGTGSHLLGCRRDRDQRQVGKRDAIIRRGMLLLGAQCFNHLRRCFGCGF